MGTPVALEPRCVTGGRPPQGLAGPAAEAPGACRLGGNLFCPVLWLRTLFRGALSDGRVRPCRAFRLSWRRGNASRKPAFRLSRGEARLWIAASGLQRPEAGTFFRALRPAGRRPRCHRRRRHGARHRRRSFVLRPSQRRLQGGPCVFTVPVVAERRLFDLAAH